MQTKDWMKEVDRVAKILNLTYDQTIELKMWSVDMAYDRLEKAQTRFTK